MSVWGMCSLTTSAVHVKRVYDMLLWFMWHFEQKNNNNVLLYFMLFTEHFKCYIKKKKKKHKHIYTSTQTMFIEPAIFELGSGCTMFYHIGWGFIAFLSNYIYTIYFCLEITVQIKDLHLLLLLSCSIPNEGNVQQPFI